MTILPPFYADIVYIVILPKDEPQLLPIIILPLFEHFYYIIIYPLSEPQLSPIKIRPSLRPQLLPTII
jgi:hypothetical protein